MERRAFLKPRRSFEVLTPAFAFPALGHDVRLIYQTLSRDLSAQKVKLPAPLTLSMSRITQLTTDMYNLREVQTTVNDHNMDFGIIAAVVMLVLWATLTFTTEAPGWVHLLLTFGIFLLIERIVARDRKRARGSSDERTRK